MSQQYVGANGAYYTIIEPALGKGGEGSVYKILEKPDYVLKVFIEKNRTETRRRKLLAMLNTPLPISAMSQITWPVDVVYDNGRFIGYVMPETKNNEDLNVMYSDKYICPLNEKITIAKNLCAAVNSIHEVGQVCGDLNPKNIAVDPRTGNVTLVDTDSYDITDKNNGVEYRCEVGLPEYIAKELQEKLKQNKGKDLKTLPLPTFTRETDLFALAVHIFALLMNGCHPFACAVDSGMDNIKQLSYSQPSIAAPQPIENIRNGFFPFYMKKQHITTPLYAPSFDMLPKNIQRLFIRAFVEGNDNPKKRPTEEEWYNELSVMQQNLKTCSKDNSHLFPSHNKVCPWCALENTMLPVTKKNNSTYGSVSNAKNNYTSSTAKTKSNSNFSNRSIQRESWPMWLLFIVTGCITGPLLSRFLVVPYVMPMIYEHVDFEIPSIIIYILLTIVGAASGAVISHFAQEKYQTADKGGPWLLLSLCVPLLTIISTALLIAAIALVVGLIYLVIIAVILVIGGAIVASCCGG